MPAAALGTLWLSHAAAADAFPLSPAPTTAGARLDTATKRRLGLPLLLWRRGVGRGGRHTGRQPAPLSATAFVPLSPTLSPRSAGAEREKRPVAVSSAPTAVTPRVKLAYLRIRGQSAHRPCS